MIKGVLTSILILIALLCNAQQESQFTQFGYTPFAYNPAYAGHHNYLSVIARHRNQWSGINGAPQSQDISVNFPKIYNALGFGLAFTNASIGIQERTEISGSYAYNLKIKNFVVSLGLQMSYRQTVNDFSRSDLIPIDGFNNDSAIDPIRYSNDIFNVGTGLFLDHPRFYIGVSIPRLVKGDLDFERDGILSDETRHLFGMFGLKFNLTEDWKIFPHSQFRITENAPFDLDFQSNFVYRNQVHLGTTIKAGGSQKSILESIGILIGFQFSPRIFSSMSYDFNTTELRQFENGTFEILLKYDFIQSKMPKHIQNPRYY